MNKKAQALNKNIEAGAILIITVIVLFLLFAALVPEAQTAGDSLNLNISDRCNDVGCFYNATDNVNTTVDCKIDLTVNATACTNALASVIPLSSLFGSGGIVFLLVMVFLLLMILRTVLPKSKK